MGLSPRPLYPIPKTLTGMIFPSKEKAKFGIIKLQVCSNSNQEIFVRNSLAVHWLRLHARNAGGTDSIPGRGTKILHARSVTKKKKGGGEYLSSFLSESQIAFLLDM